MLKTIVLTTDTTHHFYYVWQLLEISSLTAVILETDLIKPNFETVHPFEKEREQYERLEVLKDAPKRLDQLLPVYSFPSVNDSNCISKIKKLNPDIIIIFGTSKVCSSIISLPHKVCLNLHGGSPEHYRGLDSHLWAIYHGDYQNLVTTLHYVEPELDSGEIVMQEQLAIHKNTPLTKLRIINTKACLNMSALAIHGLDKSGFLPSRSQIQKGRYYSFMPKVLKEVCLGKYNRHLQNIS